MSSSLGLLLGGTILAMVIAVGCSTATGAAGAAVAGASRGERFFRTKCHACHPGGGQGVGPAIDLSIAGDFLERGKTSGRHAVPEAEWEPLFAYMNAAFGGGAAIAEAVPGAAPVVAAVPTTLPATTVVPTMAAVGDAAAGAVYYQAKCQKCHPGGSKIAGKAIPGVLVKGGSGKHGVDPAAFDNLMAYLPSLGAVPQAAAPAVAATPAPPPPTTTTAVVSAPADGGGDIQAGAQYFDMKCKKCHPGGAKITGKAIPGVLVAGGSGKHGVETAQFENLLSYLVTIGAVRTGGGPVAAGPTGTTTVAPPPPPPPPPPSGSGIIPANAGMVNCNCACQCPPGAPPEALPAACICQCSCPR